MNSHDELHDLWCSETPEPRQGEEMLAIVVEKTRTFDRQIAARNALEIAASVIVTPIFAFMAVQAVGALEKLGFALVSASGLWIAAYIWRKGTALPARHLSLDSYQQELIASYDHQIRLLKSVKYWYLAPIYAGLLIAWIGSASRIGWANLGWPEWTRLAVFTAVFGFVWLLNEAYAVPYLRRLKREVEK